MKFPGRTRLLRVVMLSVCIATTTNTFADGPPVPSEFNNPLAIVLLFVAVVLLLGICMLGYVLIGAADYYVERLKVKKKATSATLKTLFLVYLSISASAAFAQTGESAESTKVHAIGGLSESSMYALCAVIGLEVVIMLSMLFFLKQLLARDTSVVVAELKETKEAPEPFYIAWWKKLNNFRPPTEEATLTLDHDYDGIRELDNNLPPWWKYGFYACIIFSIIYLYRFHVSHSAPSTIQEYEIAMVQAEVEKQAYLATSANNVDENTVKLLTDPSALAEGKKMFTSMCIACHGAEGQGSVGPNLTDDFWLHGGGIKDVFKTIKYGVPEKGMKSWKDDFSPVQIAALASFIKSLHGTKPANAKEPQGDIYKDEATPGADSTEAPGKKIAQR